MKIDLTGKTAIVTGSTEGIGAACAAGFADSGAAVVLNGRKRETLDRVAAELVARFPASAITSVVADLATAEGCAALIAAVPEADILVNNVGVYGPKPFFDIPDAEWERFFQTNVMSGVRLARAYMRGMMERNWGRVIFISSESGLNIPADMIHYGFTKTAQLAISRGLAKLARGTDVTVNAVLPGPTLTEGVEAMLSDTAAREGKTVEEVGLAFVKTQRPSSIIQRMASPEEVANMVVYIASPLASATTGAALRVEGGVVETVG
jgi:NAD(P)-dependent dehydrogenase (short-subunit alcohol dehydrogenase family)